MQAINWAYASHHCTIRNYFRNFVATSCKREPRSYIFGVPTSMVVSEAAACVFTIIVCITIFGANYATLCSSPSSPCWKVTRLSDPKTPTPYVQKFLHKTRKKAVQSCVTTSNCRDHSIRDHRSRDGKSGFQIRRNIWPSTYSTIPLHHTIRDHRIWDHGVANWDHGTGNQIVGQVK